MLKVLAVLLWPAGIAVILAAMSGQQAPALQ
jgi:hypothetical protein